jgi:hypothetical protein
MKRLYELWFDPRDESTSLSTAEGAADLRRKGLLGPDAACFQRFEAATGEEASAIYHLRMGWEPYRHIGPAVPCPKNCGAHYYPEGSGECPNCGIIAR